ncbi:hypothetical protein Btru_070391 [Bulinus truncatus]|nr:hypothetical protein Btru_070391 [Bulinus truncatus]
MNLLRKAYRFIFRKKNTDTTQAVNIPETNVTDRSGTLPENGAENNYTDVTVNGENEDTNRQNVNERDQYALAPDLNDLENIQQDPANEHFCTEDTNAFIDEDIQNVNVKNQQDLLPEINEGNIQQDSANESFGTQDANAFTDEDIQNVNEKDQQDISPYLNELKNIQQDPANELFGTEDANAFINEDIQNVNEKDQQDLFPDLNNLENIQKDPANEPFCTQDANAFINDDIQNVNQKDQQDLSPDYNDLESIQHDPANEHFGTEDANAFIDEDIPNVYEKDQQNLSHDLNDLENIQQVPANEPFENNLQDLANEHFGTDDANAFTDDDIQNVTEKNQQDLPPDLYDLENIQQVLANEHFSTEDANAFIYDDIQNVNEKNQQDLPPDLYDLENIQQVLAIEPFCTQDANAFIDENIQNVNQKDQQDLSPDLNDLENIQHDPANEHFGTEDANAFIDEDIPNVYEKDQQYLSHDLNDLENIQQVPANEPFGTDDANAVIDEDIQNVSEKNQQDLSNDLNDLENNLQDLANEHFGTDDANAFTDDDIQNVTEKNQQDLPPDLYDQENIQQHDPANDPFGTEDANAFIDENIPNVNQKDQQDLSPDLNDLENIQHDPANDPFGTEDANAVIDEDIQNVNEKDQQDVSPDLNDLENIQQVPANEPFGTKDANAFIDENIQNVIEKDQQNLSPDLNDLENIPHVLANEPFEKNLQDLANEHFGTDDANAFTDDDIQNVNEKNQQDLPPDLYDLENIQQVAANELFGTENAVIDEDVQNVNEKNQQDLSSDLNDLDNNLQDPANKHFGTEDANVFIDEDIPNVYEKDQQFLSPDLNDQEDIQHDPANDPFGTEDANAFIDENTQNVNQKDQQDLSPDLNDLENIQHDPANDPFGTEDANAFIDEDIQNVNAKDQHGLSPDLNDLEDIQQDPANELFGTEDAKAFIDEDIQNVNAKDQHDLSPDLNDLEDIQQDPAKELFGTEDANAFINEDIQNVNEKDQQDIFPDLNDLENIQQVAANELFGTENAVIDEDIQNVNEKNQQGLSSYLNDLDNNLQDPASKHFGTEDANVFIDQDIPNVYEKDQQYLSPDLNDLEDIQQDPANELFGAEDAKAFIDEDLQNVNVKDQQDTSPDIIEGDKRDKETLQDRDTKARDNFESDEHAELLRNMSKNVETLLECIKKKNSSDEEIDGDRNDDANEEQKVNVHQQIGHTINILANEINSSPSRGTSSPNESSNTPGGLSLNLNIGDIGQRCFNGNNAPMYPIQLDENPTSGWSNTQQAANQFYHPSHQAGSPTTGSAYTTQAVNQIIVPDGFMRKMNDAERSNCDTSYTWAENVSQRESQTERLNQSSEDLLSISEEKSNEDSSDVFDEEDEFESCSDKRNRFGKGKYYYHLLMIQGEIPSQQFECAVFCLGSVKGLNETRAENVVIIVDTSHDMAIAAQNMGENAEKFYKSKIEIVRNAVKALVDEIWMNQPESKIALVTFSNNSCRVILLIPRQVERAHRAHKNYLETSHEQRDMSQVTENEMHLLTRQNETKFFPAIRLELENIADTPGQDACKAKFIWRFLVPHRFIKKTDNTLKILISQLNEALGNHTSYDSKLLEISETLTQEMSTTVVFKEECKVMLRNLRQSLEKYSDVMETIQKSLRSSHSMETSIKLAKSEIDKLKGLASALDEAMANLEKASEENEERIFKKTEERLSIMEKKIESSFGELKKLLLPSLTESSQAQMSSFMQFGSRYILADDDGDVATNILRIDLSKIADNYRMKMAGIYSNVCDNVSCRAFYSHLDICTRNGSVYNWKCRFCCRIKSIPNIILYSPNAYDVCYLHNMNVDSQINIMDYKIVFLIDVSGSMSKKCEGTQTSRLDAVKTAVINKIKQLTVKCPKRRVGLVVYNDKVTAYGAHYPQTVHGNLYDMEYLLRQGRNCSDLQPLESKRSKLITSLNGWHAQGGDALGPAILVGLGMMNNARGSKMIICNNGGGNTGIGVSNKVGAWEFYQQVVFQAKKNALVRRISPLDLFIHMDEDITRNVLATNAEIKIIMPREMYVHVSGSNDNTWSVVSFPVGNIVDSNNQIFCFQFGFRKDFHLNTGLKKSATGDFLIPVQVQVMFHDNDEKRVTRVLNFLQETSTRRDVVDLCMNAEAIVTDLGHKAAKSLLHPLWYPSVVKQFIETAKEYKKMDKIRFRPELVCKLDMIILLLEKIQEDERTDEISALVSNLVTMS